VTDIEEWAKREAVKLPPLSDEAIAEAGRLAAQIDQRIAVREAAGTEYIARLVEGRYLTPEGIARLAVLLKPESEDQ
jgi:hypothetical protein